LYSDFNKYLRVYLKPNSKVLSTYFLTIILIIIFLIPTNVLYTNSNSFCIHKKILNFNCPGCGMTKALSSFLHCRFKQAFNYNFGIFPLVLLIFEHYFTFFYTTINTDRFKKFFHRVFTITLILQYSLIATLNLI
jgi:hypothetical protein